MRAAGAAWFSTGRNDASPPGCCPEGSPPNSVRAESASLRAIGARLKSDPANPVRLAYAGAATSMKARDAMLPWKKMSYAEDGLAQVDKALSLLQPAHDAPLQNHTPGSLETRFVAASTFLSMPA